MKADAVMYCRFPGRCDGFGFFLSSVYFKGVFVYVCVKSRTRWVDYYSFVIYFSVSRKCTVKKREFCD